MACKARHWRRIGMPEEIAPRHAGPHFSISSAGEGYSAGYYSYLWSEVLDADGFGAFTEAKDPFAPAIAKRLYEYIYSSGGTRDFAQAYRDFRGRDPGDRGPAQRPGIGERTDAQIASVILPPLAIGRTDRRCAGGAGAETAHTTMAELPIVSMQVYDEKANADQVVDAAMAKRQEEPQTASDRHGRQLVPGLRGAAQSDAGAGDAEIHRRPL